jgi:predicted Zn-dependent protease with MMP-like domain
VQTFVTLNWGRPGDALVPNLGASGAISAVLGAYLILFPRARVLTLVFYFFIELPAYFFLGFWIIFQLWQGGFSVVQAEGGGGVAFFAHIGRFRLRSPHREALRQTRKTAVMTRFEEHVRAALDMLPPELAAGLENVAVVVEEQNAEEPDLYGLFDEQPYMPAKISIYRRPLVEDFGDDPARLQEEIRITVLHELAHYFGIDEERLDELGYA